MKQAQQIIDTTSPALDFSPCYKPFLLPNYFLSKNERKTAKGRIYWTTKDKKVFCETYLGVDYKTLDKHQLHFFMYEKRGGILFNNGGFPVWEYTEKPIMWEF